MKRLLFWGGGILAVLFATSPAIAYVGPGAGLSAIGTVLAVLGAFLLLLVGFVWYPVKRMLRNRKAATKKDSKLEPAAEKDSRTAASQKTNSDSDG